MFMNIALRTNYKRGDFFTADEANDTNKAILAIDASAKTRDEKIDVIEGKMGTGELKTKNNTIIGAINELNDSSSKYVINSIEDESINGLFN